MGKRMRILALDGSLARASAALFVEGKVVAARAVPGERVQPTALPPMAEALLREAGTLDAVAVVVGPGSFTGLRTAIALAEAGAIVILTGRPRPLRQPRVQTEEAGMRAVVAECVRMAVQQQGRAVVISRLQDGAPAVGNGRRRDDVNEFRLVDIDPDLTRTRSVRPVVAPHRQRKHPRKAVIDQFR